MAACASPLPVLPSVTNHEECAAWNNNGERIATQRAILADADLPAGAKAMAISLVLHCLAKPWYRIHPITLAKECALERSVAYGNASELEKRGFVRMADGFMAIVPQSFRARLEVVSRRGTNRDASGSPEGLSGNSDGLSGNPDGRPPSAGHGHSPTLSRDPRAREQQEKFTKRTTTEEAPVSIALNRNSEPDVVLPIEGMKKALIERDVEPKRAAALAANRSPEEARIIISTADDYARRQYTIHSRGGIYVKAFREGWGLAKPMRSENGQIGRFDVTPNLRTNDLKSGMASADDILQSLEPKVRVRCRHCGGHGCEMCGDGWLTGF